MNTPATLYDQGLMMCVWSEAKVSVFETVFQGGR